MQFIRVNKLQLQIQTNLITKLSKNMQEAISFQKTYQPTPNFHWIIQPNNASKTQGLAISNFLFVQNLQLLQTNNIGAVISVFGESELKIDTSVQQFRILIGDNPSENIKCFFDSSQKFIKKHMKRTNVLVHCKAGVSRSATIIMAYLIKQKTMNVNQSLELLRSKRAIVEPNKGFMKQLRQYERELKQQRQKEKCIIY